MSFCGELCEVGHEKGFAIFSNEINLASASYHTTTTDCYYYYYD